MYVRACVRACERACVRVYVLMCACVRVCVCPCVRVCICVHLYERVRVCMCVTRTFLCFYVWLYFANISLINNEAIGVVD